MKGDWIDQGVGEDEQDEEWVEEELERVGG